MRRQRSSPPTARNHVFLMDGAPGAETTIDGRKCLYFGGTGYYGLHGHPRLIRAGRGAFLRYGTHAATIRDGFGTNAVLLEVEQKLSRFFGTQAAVTFGSGYLGSLFLLQGLAQHYDIVFADELNHFSTRDALSTLEKPVVRFHHRSADDLARQLRSRIRAGERPLLVSDGIFPALGTLAPVPQYLDVLAPYRGLVALDDAHGVGVIGPNGRGTYEHFGLHGHHLYYCGTLSKAFGGHGGFIPATQRFAAELRETVGAHRGCTPTPTPIAAASAQGIAILQHHPEMRKRLWRNVALAKGGLRELGFPVEDTPVPILAWTLGSQGRMRRIQRDLLRRGVAVAHLCYQGAPPGGVLRASIFSTHTREHIRRLIDELRRLV